MADELNWRIEKEQYKWHPLYQYVESVMAISGLGMYRAGLYNPQTNQITADFDVNDFNALLQFCWDLYNGKYNETPAKIYHNNEALKELLVKFDPLIINCYNGFVLFKYKNYVELNDMGYSSDFFDLYNSLYLECRSVVFDIMGEHGVDIVLAPQPKFFNVNENEKWSDEVVRQKIDKAVKVEISNKLDGSNQNYRWYNGAIVGAGSQALDPDDSWRLADGYNLLTSEYKEMMKAYPNYTFMFEYISPKNIIVVNYTKEQEGLYLFGMRNVYTGKQLTYDEVLEIGHKYSVKCTDVYNNSYDEILDSVDDYTCNEKEGWVIGLMDKNGDIFKAKLKTTDYVLMHKAVTKLVSPKFIIEAINEGRWDDAYAKVPIGVKDIANDIAKKVYRYMAVIDAQVEEYYVQYQDLDRKDFMITVDKEVPRVMVGHVKNLYLGKPANYLKGVNGRLTRLKEIEEFLSIFDN